MIRLVVFDMAGTTINEDNIVYKTVHKCIEDAGYSTSLDTVLQIAAGKEKRQAIADLLQHIGGSPQSPDTETIFRQFVKELEQAYNTARLRPFGSCAKIFAILRERHIAIALNTGYNRHTAMQILAKTGWTEGVEYDTLVTADDTELGRPFPDMIYEAMQRLGIPRAGEVMKVGDSVTDIEEGRAAGCGISAGVTTGAQTRAQLQAAHPDYILDDLIEIAGILS